MRGVGGRRHRPSGHAFRGLALAERVGMEHLEWLGWELPAWHMPVCCWMVRCFTAGGMQLTPPHISQKLWKEILGPQEQA